MSRLLIKFSRLKKVLWLLVFLALVTVFTKLIPPIFTVKSISCISDFGPCPKLALDQLQTFIGTPLYHLNQTRIRQTLNYQLLEFSLRFPDKVFVKIDLPKPVAIIIFTNSEHNFPLTSLLVSADAVVLGRAATQVLPTVFLEAEFLPQPGQKLQDLAVYQAIQLADELVTVGFSSPHLVISYPDLLIGNISPAQIITSPQRDPKEVATTLQQLLAQTTINQKVPAKIDLRFAQPIITY